MDPSIEEHLRAKGFELTPDPAPVRTEAVGGRVFEANAGLVEDFVIGAPGEFVRGRKLPRGQRPSDREKRDVLSDWFGRGEPVAIELLERFRESGPQDEDIRLVTRVAAQLYAVGSISYNLKDVPIGRTRFGIFLPRDLGVGVRLRAAQDATTLNAVFESAVRAYLNGRQS